MSKLVALSALLAAFFLLYRLWKKETALKMFFWPALAAKIVGGVALGLIYMYYYTNSDTFVFYRDGVRLAHLARNDFSQYINFLWSGDESFSVWRALEFSQPRAVLMAKLTSFFCLMADDNYWILSAYFSIVSFFGSWSLVKTITNHFPTEKFAALLAFLFFPSTVFWSSGVIKESLAMGALFFLSACFVKICMTKKIRLIEWPVMLLAVWLAWSLKYYYAAVFFSVVATTLVVRFVIVSWIKPRNFILLLACWLGVFTLSILAVSFSRPNFNVDRFLHVVIQNYEAFQRASAGVTVHYYNFEATWSSMLVNTPWALIAGIFRPFLWESHTFFQAFVAVENLLLVVLLIAACYGVRKRVGSVHGILLISLVIYILILCNFLALSTPNLGTLSRYRVGFLSYWVFLLAIKNPLLQRVVSFMQRSNSTLVP